MKLIIVSNRLPVRLNQSASGRWEVTPSSGGLVTAMTPVLKQRGGMWIGWADAEGATPADLEKPLNDLAEQEGYDFASVQLSDEEQDRKSTRLNSSHVAISYAVVCLKTKIR